MFIRCVIVLVCWGFVAISFAEAASSDSVARKNQTDSRSDNLKQPTTKQKQPTTRPSKPSAPVFTSVTVGHRTPEDPFRSPRSVTVIPKQRLEEKQGRSVPETLMEEAGIFVQKTNHAGGAPIVRGAIGHQVLILIDGIRLNNSIYRSGPNQYLNMIDPRSLQQLEVLRGPGSIAYGSYAFGGVISATSISPPRSFDRNFIYNGLLLGRYGSADHELGIHGAIGGSMHGLGMRASLSYGNFGDLMPGGTLSNTASPEQRSFLTRTTDFGDVLTSGDSGRQAYTGYQHFFANGDISWRINPTWSLKLAYQRAQHIQAGRSDQLAAKGSLQIYDNFRDLIYLRLHSKLRPIRTNMNFTLSYHRQAETVDKLTLDRTSFAQTKQAINFDQAHTIGANWGGRSRVASWFSLSYGIDLDADFIDSEAKSRTTPQSDFKPTSANFPSNTNYLTLGAYVLASFSLWEWTPKNGFYLHVGERVNGFFANAPARDKFDAISFKQVGHAPYASLQFIVDPSLQIAFSYTEGFRAPNLQETISIGDFGTYFEVPNPNLEPEISRSLELTIRGRWQQRLQAWVTGYYSLWSNMITKKPGTYNGQNEVDGKPVTQLVNTAQASVMGIEAGASWNIIRGWSLSANINYSRGRSFKDDGSEAPLSRIPPLFANISTSYRVSKHGFIEIYALIADKQAQLSDSDKADPRIPKDGTPGWWTLNLRGGAYLSSFAQLTFSIENILDAQYKYHGSGVFAPGLNARLSLQLSI